MLDVRIAALKPGVHTFRLTPTPDEVGLAPDAFADIEVDLRLDVGVEQIFATFTARATATLECDRTLVPFEQQVEGQHAVLFTPAPLGEDEADDVETLAPDAVVLDFADRVRDTLLLALPARRVAPGAEDVPLPTAFGALRDADGEPIDPRWEALRKYKDFS